MEIKIPKNITEMRIKHLAFISKLAELGEKEYSISEIRQMNAAFLQVPFDEFPNYRPKDDIRIFTTICKAISTKPKQANEKTFIGPDGKEYIEPDESVEYNGIIYTLRKDFTKLPTSWYMDIDIAFEMHGEGFEKMPELMAAFCYIEKGLLYGQKDENKVVINSVMDRSKVFAEFMPLDKFMNLQGFFLWRWHVLQPLLMEARAKRKRIQRQNQNKNGNGKKQLIH